VPVTIAAAVEMLVLGELAEMISIPPAPACTRPIDTNLF
jgi:hypothetical protein